MEDTTSAGLSREAQGEIHLSKISRGTEVSNKRSFSCDCKPTCGFSNQLNSSSDSLERSKSARKLCGVILMCLLFMVVEIVGGLKANSLAVLTDAAHLLTDVASFFVSIFSIWASGWSPTLRQSYGFHRIEVLGALLSIQIIWVFCGVLVYEAVGRIRDQGSRVDGKLMFYTAAFGFVSNLFMAIWLGHEHEHEHEHGKLDRDDHGCKDASLTIEEKANLISNSINEDPYETKQNQVQLTISSIEEDDISTNKTKKACHRNMNIQGAYLHIIGDLIQSVGVMIGGIIIWAKPDWLIVDLLCTFVFSVLVLWTTKSMFRRVLDILMESTPHEIDAAELETCLSNIDGIAGIHDLHVWAISAGKTLLACHVTAEPDSDSNDILLKIRNYCEEEYRISHVTIQIEQQ